MSENKMQTSNSRKKRLKELIDLGGEIRSRNEFEDSYMSMKMISDIINKNDEINNFGDINERAQNTTEVVMDAQIIQMSHELVGEVMQKIGTSKFCDEEWINALVAITYKNNMESWNVLSDVASKVCHTVRFSSALIGSYDDEELSQTATQKERQKRARQVTEAEVRPENVEKFNKKESNITNLVYNQIKDIYLQTKQAIPYYKLIIDPNDFMKTVNNSFQVAFLVRDKSVYLHYGDDGLPYVRPMQKKEKEECNNDTTQVVCPLNKKSYNEWISHYGITESLLSFN